MGEVDQGSSNGSSQKARKACAGDVVTVQIFSVNAGEAGIVTPSDRLTQLSTQGSNSE